ncbi:MAG: GAF domain-containing protein [Anaerolineae bacterium]|nr:MAG: GAF domain-containing protein [Anaerolineae bacterium]
MDNQGTPTNDLTSKDLEITLATARQNVTLLRSQLRTGKINAQYFDQRLGSLEELLDQVQAERKNTIQQKRVAALYEVGKVIGSSLNLQTVLDQVMDAIIQLSGAERGFLMLLDDDGNLAVRVARNFDQETLQSDEIAFSRTITRQVFETGEPVVTTNAQEDPRYAGQVSIMIHGMRSIMATPLRARGKNTGVVYVDNRIKTGLFSDEDLEVLAAFAAQAAVALDNARLYSETDAELQARLEELRILQWIDRQLNEQLDLQAAMKLTLEWSSRLCDAQSASMGFLDREAGVISLVANYGEENEFSQTSQLPLTHPLIAQVLEMESAALQLSPSGAPPHTTLCVPVRRENNIIGVVLFSANRADAFDVDAQELVSRMADRAAIAIENARLYDAVKAADKTKSEFVGFVAHELKVPMTSISGYASLLGIVGQLSEKQQEFVKTIQNNVQRMRMLVDDLNDITRIETGQLRMAIEPVKLPDVVEQVKTDVMAQINERNHTFVEEVEVNLPPISADASRVLQILLNLLSNAYKYTPNGGKITLSAKRDGDKVSVSVKDTGVGIAPEDLQKLGTKFFRTSNTLEQPGWGLGFAITRNLIDLMKGELTIESQVGVGSTFTFTLPVAEEDPAAISEKAS